MTTVSEDRVDLLGKFRPSKLYWNTSVFFPKKKGSHFFSISEFFTKVATPFSSSTL
jgi:hypothetical protein